MDQDLSLQARIDHITSLPLLEAIPALLDLTASLTTSLSPEGQRLVLHPSYKGPAELDTLAKFYLTCGGRCTEEHAPFQLRLDYLGLDTIFYAFSEQTDEAIKEALRTGALEKRYREVEGGCCAHCRWEPAAVIPAGFADMESLYFYAEEYRLYWGNAAARGERVTFPNSVQKRYCLASREQVEDAIRRLGQPN